MTWIKVRTCLKDESEVDGIRKLTGLSVPAVVGSLQILWSWADTVTSDGFIKFADAETVDNRVDHKGFCDAMCEVGWLQVIAGGVLFPNFDTHMSESAKKRASDAKRKSIARKVSDKKRTNVRNEPDKSRTFDGQKADQRREEKRREEKKEKEQKETQPDGSLPSLPAEEQLDSLIDSWNQLPQGIAPKVNERRSEPIVKGWRKVQRTSALKAGFKDIPLLMTRIRDGTFLHGNGWFKFVWLFGKKDSQWNVLKILEGNYDRGRQTGNTRDTGRVTDEASRDGLRFLE
jgi:hypothetical protein